MGQDSQQIRKHYQILVRARDPDQVQRVLLHLCDLLRQQRRVIAAQEAVVAVRDADAEIPDTHLEACRADEVGDGFCDARVDLGGAEGGRVASLDVEEGDEEDAWDQGGGGRAAC